MVTMMVAVAAICQLFALALGASLRIQIPPSNLLPNPNTLPASTHATLTSGAAPPIRAMLRQDNALEFPNISTTGSQLVSIYSRDYVFAPFRIDLAVSSSSSSGAVVVVGAWETYRGTQWSDRGVALVAAPTERLEISAKVLSKKNFYELRQGFNPLSLLKNPMILMAVVALGLTFGMPKLMENMDPEMREEYEKMQKNSALGGVTRAMQGGGAGTGGGPETFDLAGYLAGSGKSTGNDKAAGSIRERKR